MSFDLTERFLLDRIEQLTQRGAELTSQRDAALAELAALKKRLADAPRRTMSPSGAHGQLMSSLRVVALVPLKEEEV